MKYNIRQFKNGEWAVFQGSRVFMNTKTAYKPVADREALEMSAKWYMAKFKEAHDLMEKRYPETIDERDPWGYTV